MKPLELTLCGFGLCLALTAASRQVALAQADSLDSLTQGYYSGEAAAQELFGDRLAPIVPVGYGGADSAGCVDGGSTCDLMRACPTSGMHCCDDLWTRASLTDGFWGAQPALAAQGIVYDAQLTQFYQGVASGGGEQVFKYGGKLDQFVIFNSKELGLWEGMQIVLHAETRFGEDVIADAALLAPVNTNLLYPSLENETAVTGLQITQALSETCAVTFGKINALDLFYGLYPQTGRGVDGFMNTSMVIPLTMARSVPLSFLGAGVVRLHEKQFQGGVLVYDSYNSATTSGFDNLFTNGANVTGFWRFFTEMGGLPGSHLFLGTYASGDYTSLDRTGWSIVPGQGPVVPQQTGSWSLIYILEQQLWVDPCHEQRSIGLLSTWGLSDEQTSPYRWVGNVALQAQGLLPGREQDSLGVGYFYNGLSGDFKSLLPVLDVGDLQGVELYYNAALAPWFHVTADLQVVEPALGARDTALVVGLRAKIAL